jgi:hypothetical protein
MDIDTLITRLQEIRASYGNAQVDVVAEDGRVQVEEACGDVAYDAHDGRVKLCGESV